MCRFLESRGFTITYLPVDSQGMIDLQAVAKAISPMTILISIMHANNEVGSIQPIREISEIAHENGILFHSDGAQSIGKIPVYINDLDIDLLSIAGHKLYAPKGVGALYIRSGVKLDKFIHGAGQERDYRAGTENILEIVGLGKAFELINENLEDEINRLGTLRDRLEDALLNSFPSCRVNGHRDMRLPNTTSISFKGLEANRLVSLLANKVAVSAGAACHSDMIKVSSVLDAMHIPLNYAMGTVRLSTGRFSTEEEIDQAIIEIKNVVNQLMDESR